MNLITKETLIKQLQAKDEFILAIDGMCASGKSTLALELKNDFHGHVFKIDDFYLPLSKQSQSSYKGPGAHIDYQRFLETVLLPLSLHQTVYYQSYDCQSETYSEMITISYCPFNIIEGSYALNPLLSDYYSDEVVLKISKEKQLERLKARDNESLEMFINKWIPLENEYLAYYDIEDHYPIIMG